ncbi:unnamed protein product [Closterium sp. NIES-54]
MEDWSWKQYMLERETRKAEEEQGPRPVALPLRLTDLDRLQEPLTIVELFGGIGTGLATALKAGCRVKKWVLVEVDPVVRRMAMHHLRRFKGQYPSQLMSGVETEAEEDMVNDIRAVSAQDVQQWGKVDLLVARWECQGVSRAGKGLGLEDPRSMLFSELLRVMKLVYQQHGEYIYILENSDFSTDRREPVRSMMEIVAAELGAGVAWDAVQQGSYSHRVHRYWQNGISEGKLSSELIQTERPSPRLVEDILEPHRTPAPVLKPDHPSQPGMVYDSVLGKWEEPMAKERELAMGFLPDAIAAPGVEEMTRREALGRAMDAEAMHWLIHTIQMHLAKKQLEMEAEVGGPGDESEADVAASQQRVEQALLDMLVEKQEQRERGWAMMAREVDPEEWGGGGVGFGQAASPEGASGAAPVAVGEVTTEEPDATEAAAVHEQPMQMLSQGPGCGAPREESQEGAEAVDRTGGRDTEWEIWEGIKLSEEIPVYQRKRRMSPGDLEICTDKCKELLEAGLIRPSKSEYAAATVVAARKDLTGGILSRRMCGDYRDLNKLTVADRYPMPTPEDIFDKLQGACVFSTLNLRQGFNQIRIAEGDHCSTCYIDDVVVFSSSGEQHAEDVGQVLAAIGAAGLTCHPKKCHFGSLTVQYLGFEVYGGRMSIQEAKVAVPDRLAVPDSRTTLRAILGFLNYYRKFVPNFSKWAAPLNQLLREDMAWKWGEVEQGALRELLEAVNSGPVLQLPKPDGSFTLYTDWSSAGMGAVLCQ